MAWTGYSLYAWLGAARTLKHLRAAGACEEEHAPIYTHVHTQTPSWSEFLSTAPGPSPERLGLVPQGAVWGLWSSDHTSWARLLQLHCESGCWAHGQ